VSGARGPGPGVRADVGADMGTDARRAAREDAGGDARQPAAFDVAAVREDFPILGQIVRGRPLAYLDNAATTQKPRAVIDAISRFYTHSNANVHRGLHDLSEQATAAYERARAAARRLLNAAEDREIVFVRGTTEAINLVAQAWGRTVVGEGDEILVTEMEHHSNIVPWQLLCGERGAHLRVAPITDGGELRLDALERLIGPRTRLVALAHVSNALGTVNPVRRVVEMAHARGVPVLVDGAQAVPHMPVDVRALGCDFYALSGHKVFGPTGIGVLYGRAERLEAMPPWQGGGDMIASVSFAKTTYNRVPYRFEAGTPDIAGAIGLGAAIEYLERIGWAGIEAHEKDLLAHADRALGALPGVQVLAAGAPRVGVASFVVDGVHPHDVGTILDMHGVAVRAGHHCAQPLMDRLGVPATTRASLSFYNTHEEIDALVTGLGKVLEVFGR
jgi:cysteine desulfurase/selenocysteine lyase